jgi:hypothetical protein
MSQSQLFSFFGKTAAKRSAESATEQPALKLTKIDVNPDARTTDISPADTNAAADSAAMPSPKARPSSHNKKPAAAAAAGGSTQVIHSFLLAKEGRGMTALTSWVSVGIAGAGGVHHGALDRWLRRLPRTRVTMGRAP